MMGVKKVTTGAGTRYLADYRDSLKRRRRRWLETKHEADDVYYRESRLARRASAIDPAITVEQYGEGWLRTMRHAVRASTLASYEGALRGRVFPLVGREKLVRLHRQQLKELLSDILDEGCSRDTARIVCSALSGMLAAAVEDGLPDNPIAGVRKAVKLGGRTRAERRIRPFEPRDA